MKKFFLICLIVVSGSAYSQLLNLVTTENIPGIVQVRYDTLTGQDLTKYLGQQASLFYEYGFRQMCISDYNLAGDNARLEVYLMAGPASAYGIYSVTTSICNQRNLFSTFSCISSGQVSAVTGPFFIRVLNVDKTQNGLTLCGQIVQAILQNNPQDPWYLPPLAQMPGLSPYLNSLKYIAGPLGLSAGAPILSDLLENIPFQCYTLTIITPAAAGTLCGILFPDGTYAGNFLTQAGLNITDGSVPTMAVDGTYQSWYPINDSQLIFLKSNSSTLRIIDLMPEKVDFFNYR